MTTYLIIAACAFLGNLIVKPILFKEARQKTKENALAGFVTAMLILLLGAIVNMANS